MSGRGALRRVFLVASRIGFGGMEMDGDTVLPAWLRNKANDFRRLPQIDGTSHVRVWEGNLKPLSFVVLRGFAGE